MTSGHLVSHNNISNNDLYLKMGSWSITKEIMRRTCVEDRPHRHKTTRQKKIWEAKNPLAQSEL